MSDADGAVEVADAVMAVVRVSSMRGPSAREAATGAAAGQNPRSSRSDAVERQHFGVLVSPDLDVYH